MSGEGEGRIQDDAWGFWRRSMGGMMLYLHELEVWKRGIRGREEAGFS